MLREHLKKVHIENVAHKRSGTKCRRTKDRVYANKIATHLIAHQTSVLTWKCQAMIIYDNIS